MSTRLTSVFLLLILAFPVSLSAEDPSSLYATAVSHLYNLDFPSAESTFLSLTRDHPSDPDYWNALASTYWLKILYNQQKLDLASFSSKDRFGTADSKDVVSPADEQQLRDTLDKAIAISDDLLKKNPRDIRGLFAKGSSYATLASFEATIRRSYTAAARHAKTARNLHREVLKIDPSYHDARTAVGIYNYAVGSLSPAARFLVWMIGLGGDGKDSGIKDLETAAAKGTRSATDAKMLLVVVYGREEKYDQAIKLIDELLAKYPRNFMLDMSKASLYGNQKKWDLAAQTYKQIADKVVARTNGYERMRVEKVYYELANAQFQAKKFDDATSTFGMVVRGPGATTNEKASAHLWMGRMSDTANKRADALSHYNAVLGLDADANLKSDARQHIRKPFGRP